MQQFLGRPRLRLQTVTAALVVGLIVGIGHSPSVQAQTSGPLTWAAVRAHFEAANPVLKADQFAIDESKAAEITASLRPNPQLSVTADQIHPGNMPLSNVLDVATLTYLHERRHKRELRRDSAQGATAIAASNHVNLDRTLLFTLRSAFVQVLSAKAALALARDNLTFYDRVLEISRGRLQAGDIAQIDMDRLDLQRVQLESAVETADVNMRTAKIQLRMLINDGTPIDQFDVTGPFDFTEALPTLDDLRRQALDARPDLRAALQAIEKAKTDHRLAVANGSTDPTIGVDAGVPQSPVSYTPSLNYYAGVSLSIPLRIFDRNQGEKLRTQLDIGRNERLTEAARAQVFNDVDSARATLVGTVNLLRPYKGHYLAEATRVRDIVTFSYERGGAALLDFLQAEQDYRAVQLAYVNLVSSYLTAAAQLNMAVGREVIP